MNRHRDAKLPPASPWRDAMSVPRELPPALPPGFDGRALDIEVRCGATRFERLTVAAMRRPGD